MFTPDDMNLRATTLDLKAAADGRSGAPFRQLALEWRLLAVQSIYLDALLVALDRSPDPAA